MNKFIWAALFVVVTVATVMNFQSIFGGEDLVLACIGLLAAGSFYGSCAIEFMNRVKAKK